MLKCLVRTLLALLLLVSPAVAFALSCIPNAYTLQEAHDSSDAIIIAIVSDCAVPKSADGWSTGGDSCTLSTLEVIKAASPARDYTVIADSAGCGLSLHVGHQYLLFLDELNGVLKYSTPLQGSYEKSDPLGAHLEILRDYRDGRINDLPEPWFYYESEQVCTLYQAVGFTQITFQTVSAGWQVGNGEDWQLQKTAGEWVYRRTQQSAGETNNQTSQSVTVSSTLPDFPNQRHSLQVSFSDTRPAPNRLAVLSADGTSWQLHQTRTRSYRGERMSHESVVYVASEKSTMSILEHLDSGIDFTVTALAVADAADGDDTSQRQFGYRAPEPELRVDSKSDRIHPALAKYRECLEKPERKDADATR